MVTRTYQKKSAAFGVTLLNTNGSMETRELGVAVTVTDTVTHDGPLKNWKERIRARLSATTSLSGISYPLVAPGSAIGQALISGVSPYIGPYTYGIKGFYGDVSSMIWGAIPAVSGLSITSADNEAKAEFIRKATRFQTAIQGGVFLGELRETIQLIRRPAETLRDLTTGWVHGISIKEAAEYRRLSAKRSGSRSARQKMHSIKKACAEKWLEFSFGVQPLLSDIDSGMEAASRAFTYHPPSKLITGRGRKVGNRSTSSTHWMYPGYSWGGVLYMTGHRELWETADVRYRGLVLANPFGFNGSSSQYGLTWNQVVPAIYELIPYSFLVDYFSNLGDIVSASCFLRSSIAWIEKGVCLTRNVRLRKAEVVYGTQDPSETYIRTLGLGSRPHVQRREVTRSAYTGDMVPSLELEFPGLPRQWLNIGALLTLGRESNRFSTIG